MTKEERIEEYVDNYVILDGLDKEGIAHFKQLVKDVCTECVKNEVAELEQENAELKKEWQEQVQKATDEGYARTLQTIQLNKAKALLKQFLEAKNSEDTYKAEFEAEQFLKESEVEK